MLKSTLYLVRDPLASTVPLRKTWYSLRMPKSMGGYTRLFRLLVPFLQICLPATTTLQRFVHVKILRLTMKFTIVASVLASAAAFAPAAQVCRHTHRPPLSSGRRLVFLHHGFQCCIPLMKVGSFECPGLCNCSTRVLYHLSVSILD